MSDAAEDKPKLEALDGGKSEPKLRGEDEIRKALAALVRRHAIQKAATIELSAARGDWRAVADGAADLRRLEGQIEVLEYVLGNRRSVS